MGLHTLNRGFFHLFHSGKVHCPAVIINICHIHGPDSDIPSILLPGTVFASVCHCHIFRQILRNRRHLHRLQLIIDLKGIAGSAVGFFHLLCKMADRRRDAQTADQNHGSRQHNCRRGFPYTSGTGNFFPSVLRRSVSGPHNIIGCLYLPLCLFRNHKILIQNSVFVFTHLSSSSLYHQWEKAFLDLLPSPLKSGFHRGLFPVQQLSYFPGSKSPHIEQNHQSPVLFV